MFKGYDSLTPASDLTTALASLTKDDREDECIKHSLEVRSAWALNNYHKFFKLYLSAPKMAGYLMDKFVDRVRKNYLIAIVKAYVSLQFYLTSVCLSDMACCFQWKRDCVKYNELCLTSCFIFRY